VPCPPLPDFDKLRPEEDKEAVRGAVFAAVVDWMLVNYAYYKGAFMGKGGIISLVDGEILSIASVRGLVQPYALMNIGPKGGIKIISAVDT